MTRLAPTVSLAFLAVLVASAGVLAVGGALVFEHGFGYVPCMLCLWQRWPYYLGAPLALLAGAAASTDRTGLARILLGLVAVTFLIGAGLGAYHAGVEWSLWPGPTSCAGADAAPVSAGGLLAQMKTTRLVPCDRAAWRLFGISLAGFNLLIAGALAAASAWGAARAR